MTEAPETLDAFLARWGASGGAERADYQIFLAELCDLLEIPRPEPTRPGWAEAKGLIRPPIVDKEIGIKLKFRNQRILPVV